MTPHTRIGRYELVRLLGEGGMGTVHEAVLHGPAGFHKRIALKRLKASGLGLVAEARLGGLLRHRNLVETYALEQIDGEWLCAMELVEGGSLRAHLPLPLRATIEVGLQVCEGLAHAHDEIGLVHLDLKPENLLLQAGVVKIADLGIARARGFGGDGLVRGTPRYMAPEHRAGQPVDARADIYALGVVLLELATGLPSGTTGDDALDDVIRRCVEPDPSSRYASMRELQAALAALAPGPPTSPGLAEAVGASSAWTPSREHGSGESRSTLALSEAVEPTNIGPDLDAFVGRQAELEQLRTLLEQAGVVTIKGTGGIGKTRLGRAVAREWHQRLGRAAWFADLSAIRDRTDLPAAVAAVLDLSLGKAEGDAQIDLVGRALDARGPALLVLDNTEQIARCASTIARWAELAPEVRLLVTSRVPLHCPAERVFEPGPLDPSAARILLADRSGGRVAPDDADVAELVDALDRLPLAIELVAGRLALLTAGQILERLSERFRLLGGRQRGRDARQATLRGTLDWSWGLLAPESRHAASACAVFAGPFDVEGAESVIGDAEGTWALDSLQVLLDHSFLQQREDGRLAMYESTREYAREHLDDAGPVQSRHAEWFARLDPHGSPPARGQPRPEDLADLFAATRWSLEEDATERATGCLAAAWSVIEHRGPYGPFGELAERLAARAPTSPRALLLAGYGARLAGRPEAARAHLDRAHELAHRTGSARLAASVVNQLGCLELEAGQLELARAHYDHAIRLAEEGDFARMTSVALNNRAITDSGLGRVDQARADYERALEIAARIDDGYSLALATGSLGLLDLEQGAMESARARLERAARLHLGNGNARMAAIADANLGNLHQVQGRLDAATEHYRRAQRAFRAAGDVRMEAILAGLLADAAALAGDLATARDQQRRAIALLEPQNASHWVARAHQQLALYDLTEGRPREAADRLEAWLPLFAEGDPRNHASARASYGEALARSGSPERGVQEVEAALETLRAADWRLDLGAVLCTAARTLHAAGRPPEARLALDEARAIAEALETTDDAPIRREILDTEAFLDDPRAP